MAHDAMIPPLRKDAAEIIITFIKSKIAESNAAGAVIGMSGGLDSSVVASLCVRALGKAHVLGIMMPDGESDQKDLEDAIAMVKILGMKYRVVEIVKPLAALNEILPDSDLQIPESNIKARTRMIILYYFANASNYRVFGCGNKTELMVGYFTKFGDGGADYLPIGDIYKTQVREIAKRLNIPEHIVRKRPSAGLWKGQTDEDELGISYDLLDQILAGLETETSIEEIAKKINCEHAVIKRIQNMVRQSAHKRRTPLIPKIGLKTPGFDWREF